MALAKGRERSCRQFGVVFKCSLKVVGDMARSGSEEAARLMFYQLVEVWCRSDTWSRRGGVRYNGQWAFDDSALNRAMAVNRARL